MAKILSCYSNRIESVSLRKCPYDHWLTNKTERIQALSQWQKFLRFFAWTWRQKSAGINIEQNYVIVTLCVAKFPVHLAEARIFTARCYASAVLAMALCLSVCPSVCPSVCLSVTSRSSTKTAKRRITQTTPHDSPGNLVFWYQRSPRNSTGASNAGGVGQNRRLSTNSWLYLENGRR